MPKRGKNSTFLPEFYPTSIACSVQKLSREDDFLHPLYIQKVPVQNKTPLDSGDIVFLSNFDKNIPRIGITK